MDNTLFEDLKNSLESRGAEAAIQRLCVSLRQKKDYHNLFYALLMKKRHQLGVNPVPTSSALQLPKEVHAPYEEGIREAARTVGNLYLEEGDIAQAWPYFNMLGETAPVAGAI